MESKTLLATTNTYHQDKQKLNLNNFSIPKKVSDELIRVITNEDKDDQEEYTEILEFSYFSKQNLNDKYEMTSISEIKNKDLSQIFNARYKELLLQRKGPDKLKPQKRKLFYLTEKEDEAKDIAKNGFKCDDSADIFKNALGPSKSGIHLCKHIDLLLNYQYSKNIKAFYVVLTEVIITDILLIRSVPVKQTIDPSCSHNIHAVQKLINDVPINMPEERYLHSLFYTYDYEFDNGGDLLEKPRHVLPSAIFKYELKNPYHFDKKIFRYKNKKPNTAPLKMLDKNENNKSSIEKSQQNNSSFLNAKAKKVIIETTLPQIPKPQHLPQLPQIYPQSKDLIKQSAVIDLINENASDNKNSPPPQLLPFTTANSLAKNKDTQDIAEFPFIENEQHNNNQSQIESNNLVKEIEPVLIQEKPVRLPGCTLNLNFRPMSPPPPDSLIQNDEESSSSDDEPIDPALQILEEYGDLIDELYVKPSKWRLIYEMTGRLDVKFKGSRKMGCQIEDIRKSKLKFIDEEKTKLNLKNSTNNLIFMYQSKKLASSSLTTVINNNTIKNNPPPTQSSVALTPKVPSTVKTSTTSTVPTTTSNNNNNNSINNTNKKPTVTSVAKPTVKNPIKGSIKTNSQEEKKKTDEALKKIFSQHKAEQAALQNKNNKNATNKNQSQKSPKSNVLTKPKSDNSISSTNTTGLSSENTSLEKRLLSMDKAKKLTLTKSASTTATSKTTNNNESSLSTDEQIKKILKAEKEKQQAANLAKNSSNNIKLLPVKSEPTVNTNVPISNDKIIKRKKSFWEPDSDSEYDKIKKLKLKTESSTENSKNSEIQDDVDDGDDDIVIVKKMNLNLPPMQYSKPFYDINIKSFETELRKITQNSPQLAKCSSSELLANNLIINISKSPIKPPIDNPENKPVTKEELKMNRRLNLANRGHRQRYIHHIVTNYPKNIFDVDGLKSLVNASKSDTSCLEIHAGGFSCIEEHNFQYTSSFMRRAQSFSNTLLNLNLNLHSGFDSESSVSNDSTRYNKIILGSQSCSNIHIQPYTKLPSFSKNTNDDFLDHTPNNENSSSALSTSNKRISLNDYVSLRAKSSSQISTSSTTIKTEPIQISDEPTAKDESAQEIQIKNEPTELISDLVEPQPIKEETQHRLSPKKPSYVNKQLPSLSLIDELKKRIYDDKMNKENNSYNDEYCKKSYSDDEDSEEDSEKEESYKSKKRHRSKSKLKSKHQHKKKSSKMSSNRKKKRRIHSRHHHHHHHHHSRSSYNSDDNSNSTLKHHHHKKIKKNSNSGDSNSNTSDSDNNSSLLLSSSSIASSSSIENSPTSDTPSLNITEEQSASMSNASMHNSIFSSPKNESNRKKSKKRTKTRKVHAILSSKHEKNKNLETEEQKEYEDEEEGEINEDANEHNDVDEMESEIDQIEQKLNKTLTEEIEPSHISKCHSSRHHKNHQVESSEEGSLSNTESNNSHQTNTSSFKNSDYSDLDKVAKEFNEINRVDETNHKSTSKFNSKINQYDEYDDNYGNFYSDYDIDNYNLSSFKETNHKEDVIENKNISNYKYLSNNPTASNNNNKNINSINNNSNENFKKFPENKNKYKHYNTTRPAFNNKYSNKLYSDQKSSFSTIEQQNTISPSMNNLNTPLLSNPRMALSFNNQKATTPSSAFPNQRQFTPNRFPTNSNFNQQQLHQQRLNQYSNNPAPIWPAVNKSSSSAIAAAAAKAFTELSGVDSNTIDPQVNEFIKKNFEMALEMMPNMNPNNFVPNLNQFANVANNKNSSFIGVSTSGNSGSGVGLGVGRTNYSMNHQKTKDASFGMPVTPSSSYSQNTNINKNTSNINNNSGLQINNQQQMYSQNNQQMRFQNNNYNPQRNNNNNMINGGFKSQINKQHRFASNNNNRQQQPPQNVFRYKKTQNDQEDGEIVD